MTEAESQHQGKLLYCPEERADSSSSYFAFRVYITMAEYTGVRTGHVIASFLVGRQDRD